MITSRKENSRIHDKPRLYTHTQNKDAYKNQLTLYPTFETPIKHTCPVSGLENVKQKRTFNPHIKDDWNTRKANRWNDNP